LSNRWLMSPTQLETFLTCPRRWGYQYLDKIEIRPSKAAELGRSIHKALENYLIDNAIDIETREGQIASAGLPLLPKSIPKENIERHILFSHDGFIFQGYIDFFHHLGSQTWLIGDHKTCSSFNNALSSKELKKNIQANIYAQWFFKEKGAEAVKLKWIYYSTKGKPQAKVVETELKKDEALPFFEHLLAVAADIKDLAEKRPTSSELPKNTSACFKYGPCPFYSHCKNDQRIPQTFITAKEEESQSALLPRNTSSFHLYIDCVPTKSENPYERTIELSELLKPVLIQIQTDKQLSHYRLAGYGQHVGLIANYLENHLNEQHYDSNTAVLSSLKTPEGCDTLQTLSKAAGQIVRGF
jgi:CRISPR/Cas system-associated exonuclease Cas4 (RecB family)